MLAGHPIPSLASPQPTGDVLTYQLFDMRHGYRTIELLLTVAVQLQDSKALRTAILRAFSLFKVFNLDSHLP